MGRVYRVGLETEKGVGLYQSVNPECVTYPPTTYAAAIAQNSRFPHPVAKVRIEAIYGLQS